MQASVLEASLLIINYRHKEKNSERFQIWASRLSIILGMHLKQNS